MLAMTVKTRKEQLPKNSYTSRVQFRKLLNRSRNKKLWTKTHINLCNLKILSVIHAQMIT